MVISHYCTCVIAFKIVLMGVETFLFRVDCQKKGLYNQNYTNRNVSIETSHRVPIQHFIQWPSRQGGTKINEKG